MSAYGICAVTRTLYRYRPKTLTALGILATADGQDAQTQRDIRDALWVAYGIRSKADEEKKAEEAQAGAYALLEMFEGAI